MNNGFINRIIKSIKKFDYVSFDVFDTLLKRDVYNPKDVFKLVEKEFEDHFSIENSHFYENRIVAEKNKRTKSVGGELNYDQIYEELTDMNIYTSVQIDYLKRSELAAEETLLHANTAILPIFQYCRTNNKKIIIISDMYLPSSFIADALKKNGFYFDYIYVSNECDKMKYDGTIYPYMLKKLNISRKNIVHIGDSWRADFAYARIKGIKSVHMPKRINNLDFGRKYNKKLSDSSFEERILTAFLNNKNYSNCSDYYKLGYEAFGIVLYGFSLWLKSRLDENKTDRIFFLSRDGYIMKEVFDILYPEYGSEYLYVSRRSLSVPCLHLCGSFDEICQFLTLTKRISVKAFIQKLGLDFENYKREISRFSLKEETVFDGKNIKSNSNIMNFYECIKDDVIKNSEKEYAELISYLESKNFFGKLAIADIGWQGTMQKALNLIAAKSDKINAEITGYYVGFKSDINGFNGYLFDKNQNKQNEYAIFSFGGLFESFFLAHHGSVMKYKENNPVLYDYEYKDEKDVLKIVSEIQNGAVDFVKEFSSRHYLSRLKFSVDEAIYNISMVGSKPKNKIIKMFSDVFLYDTEKYYLLPQKSLIYYVFNIKEFLTGLNQSFWKVGYLKKIFKLPLSYDKIYKWLKKSV